MRMAIVPIPGRNSTTITATAEHEVYIYKSVILYLDGLIRRYRVLALTVWGPFLTSPIIRTRGGGVMIQTVEGAIVGKTSALGHLSKPIVRSHPCANFYYNTWSFLPSLCHSKANP